MANIDLSANNPANFAAAPTLPRHAQLVVVNDVYSPPAVMRADAAGAVTFVPGSGATAITMNLAAGEIIPVQVRQVTVSAVALHLVI